MRNLFGFSFSILLMLIVFASCSKEDLTIAAENEQTEILLEENAGKKANVKGSVQPNKLIINSGWITLTWAEFEDLELGIHDICLVGNCDNTGGAEVLQCFDLGDYLMTQNVTDNTIDVKISGIQHLYTSASPVWGCYGGDLYVTYKDQCGCILEQYDFPPSSGFQQFLYINVDLGSLLGSCTALC